MESFENSPLLTLGSLFDGSGGFPLAGILSGITPIWASEIEPFAVRVTTARIPQMKHYGDVSQISGKELPPVDIITFGSPCQDMSIAGKRSGLEGSRSSLFYEAIRIVKEMREKTNGEKPKWICWENVPGAFSSNGGADFRAVLQEIVQIVEPTAEVPAPDKKGWPYADYLMGDGWSVAYRVLDAQGWGVPQRRARIFLVGHLGGERAPEVLFESEGLSGYSAEGFRAWQRAANHSEYCLGAAGGTNEECGGDRRVTDALAVDGYNSTVSDEASTLGVNCGMSTGRNGIVLNDQGGDRMDVTEEVTCTLRAEAHHPPVVLDEPQAFHINQRDEGIDLHGVSGALMATRNNQMQTFVVEQQEAVSAAGFCTEHSANARSIGYEEETAPTLRAGVVPATIALENHPADNQVKISEDDISQTLTSRMGTGGNNVPLVMEEDFPAQTLKIRSGCEGGGKGSIRQVEKSATLSCNNDQTVFVPFVKGTRPHSAGEAPTWKEGETANTLNTYDVGETRCNELAVKAYGICSKGSHSMMSDNPHSGFYEAETSRTLDANGGNPNCNQGGIAIVAFTQNQRNEVRDLKDVSSTLAAEPGTKQQTYVLQGSMIGRSDKNGPQGDGINEDVSFTLDTTDRHAVAYCMTTGEYTQVTEEKTPTLMARDYKDPPIVTEKAPISYGIGRDAYNQGRNAQFNPTIEEELSPTIIAKDPGAVATFTETGTEERTSYGFDPQKKGQGTGFQKEISSTLVIGTNPGHHNGVVETAEYPIPKVAGTVAVGAHPSGFNGQDAYNDRLVCDPLEPFYIVRRLTPTECARLQGFPDGWCKGLEIENPTPEDIAFWSEVWETHRKIMGTSKKPKSEKQIIKWLKNPHSDSAEYKLWGNGVALPCVFFVLAGIVWASETNT